MQGVQRQRAGVELHRRRKGWDSFKFENTPISKLFFGASSVFQLDAFFIRAATGPPRLGEGEPLIRRGKAPLSTTSASPITLGNTPTSPRVSGYVREQSSHSNG